MLELLKISLTAREEEVGHYQFNIDNYRRAIEKADKDPEMNEFADQLRELLRTSSIEQKKAQIMLEVIQDQLKDLEV